MTTTLSGPVQERTAGAGTRTGSGSAAHRAALAQLADASHRLGLDDGLHQMLAIPRRLLTVAVPMRREDGSLEILRGYRVQHNLSRGPQALARLSPDLPPRMVVDSGS
ncbi:Glu/Leu/Phe/Val dehydrogenase, dimerisation domain [Modestobacter sp. DSM 44400]|uniref:Glu/Leu/Phe/Val dehydrogenase dimerization domain-containing protein n=1 Tax=Modestobacter sp. DSM 44400 TaxID=1550230 RepID=UPI0008982EB5|nr:Glu/Leu/Phe/Val dehydrogenase dimerization domain-containing protein [Modestobacter sp. DSM 44400]SDY74892.1 Glu/Leu/Phe/Val dehydrogenase, dimerisation domain [Modestobacter sp. DSM 44400]